MQQNQLNRILHLVRRTGDRFILADAQTDEVFAIMNLDEYENLLEGGEPLENLTEEEMLGKVNRDISSWRAHHRHDDIEDLFDEEVETNDWESDEDAEPEEIPEEVDYEENTPEPESESEQEGEPLPAQESPIKAIAPVEPVPVVVPIAPADQAGNPVGMPSEEVSLRDLPDDGEQKFYLEPVE